MDIIICECVHNCQEYLMNVFSNTNKLQKILNVKKLY